MPPPLAATILSFAKERVALDQNSLSKQVQSERGDAGAHMVLLVAGAASLP
ncbi:unannotated protein [freshwater metagenome]|uniref:Unannotated protein n=1 Tax=freshwater metagenome TaxID=449393 RepID=A0A6J7DHI6_9ZZZZ|nr:hypothetical protein [Actinomycetota bacterium]MUH58150.1 hypothetical protein [Actinomycetota bacterium]